MNLFERDVLTTGEVAKICNVASRTVSKWFDSGQLRGYRIPGSKDRRIPVSSLIRFMKSHNIPLDGLMSGLGAMVNDKPESAPSWQDIGDRMMAVAPSILYGIAGARNNAWQPGVGAEPTSACSHSYCETGDALAPSCDPCVAKVIAADDYCQQTHWDSYCVEAVESLCDVACE